MVQLLPQRRLFTFIRIHFDHGFVNGHILCQVNACQIHLAEVTNFAILVPNLEILDFLQLLSSHFFQTFEAWICRIAFFRRERVLKISYGI